MSLAHFRFDLGWLPLAACSAFLVLCSVALGLGLGYSLARGLARALRDERERSSERDPQAPSTDLLAAGAPPGPRARLLFDLALDPVILLDGRGSVRDWNPQAEALFGSRLREGREAPVEECIVPATRRSEFRQVIERLATGGRDGSSHERLEGMALQADGTEIPAEISISFLSGSSDLCFAVVVRNVSDTKHVEDELIRARDAAIQATSAKSEFLATMSHEIRTPMNGVLGMTELLLQTELTASQKHLAHVAYRSAESLLRIINDILDFSKIESGRLELEEEVYDLHDTVEQTVVLQAGTAHANNLELICEIESSVPRLQRGDAARLRQILTNLVANGIKFTQRGEVMVRVHARPEEGERGTLHFEVSDSGIGIAPEAFDHIFEPFHQADGSTTRDYGGTGLGLAICKRLVESMGGRISVRSKRGRGSSFVFTLPMSAESQPPAVPEPVAGLSELRALIVDDNETNRQILARRCTTWGMRCETAGSPDEALNRLRTGRETGSAFDLAILDLQMPDVDGLQLLRQVTTQHLLPPSQIVTLLSIGMDAMVAAARDLGCREYLVKPVLQKDLQRSLRRLVGASPAADRLEGPGLDEAEESRHGDLRARVLLVEDNPVNREVAQEMLVAQGCEVDLASNGFEALAAIETQRDQHYDVVLMDCEMPRMDGFEATREIRARERERSLPRIPIVATTANVLKDTKRSCQLAGMDDYLGKPITATRLREVLERVLSSRGASESALGPSPPDSAGTAASDDSETRASPKRPPAEAAPEEAVIQRAALEQLRAFQSEGKTDLATRAIDLYLGSAPGLLETLRQAVAEDDARSARTAAHSLKSSSANLGALHFADACRRFEKLAAESSLKEIERDLDDVCDEYDRVREALLCERRE